VVQFGMQINRYLLLNDRGVGGCVSCGQYDTTEFLLKIGFRTAQVPPLVLFYTADLGHCGLYVAGASFQVAVLKFRTTR